MRRYRLILPLILLIGVFSPLAGQESEIQPVDERLAARDADFEVLLELALGAAERKEWDLAFKYLDDAENYYPDDPRITSYRASFRELAALDEAQKSWSEGIPTEVTVDDSGSGTGEGDELETEGEPKFTIDRGDRDPRQSPILTRDLFRAELAIKFFATDPVDSESRNTWSSPEEFFYASLGLDVGYWMPILRRSLGFNFRSSGYSYRPGDPDLLFNTLDLGFNLRGFLLESKTSRLELGLDFGASLQTSVETEGESGQSMAIFLGLLVSDPVLYHLFNADSLENMIFSGGIRIYSSRSEEILEMVNYRLAGYWRLNRGQFGIRLEWWDFVNEGSRTNMLSFSLTGGFNY